MTDRHEVRLGLVGTGWMAGVHGYAAARVPGLQVTRVASRTQARATATAERLGARVVDLDAVADDVDGVVVCTPPAQHAPHALAAVAKGAGVMIEKPLCTTLDEADALVAAEDAGATIAYAENLLHAPAVVEGVRQAAALDGIDVLEVRALQPPPGRGEFLTAGWGGGVLFDLGVHPVAVALALAAPARPVEVRATLTGGSDHPVDEHAEVRIAFDSGLFARVEASWREAGAAVWDAQVSAPGGVVRVDLLPDVRVERNGVEVPLPRPPAGVRPELEEMGYLPQIEAFALDLARGRQARHGARFGREVLELVCAAYWSAGRRGAWVELPFDGPRDRPPISLWRQTRLP